MEQADIFYTVAKCDDIESGEGKIVFAGTTRVALFNYNGEIFCIQNNCPHAGGHLGLGAVKGCIVKCPRHDWGFDFTTGKCKTDPRYSAKQYEVKIEDGNILVGLPAPEQNNGPEFL